VRGEGHGAPAETTSRADSAPAVPAPLLTTADYLGAARSLAERLIRTAVHGADGSVEWLAPQVIPDIRRVQVGVMGSGLYDGLAGVALFLAALSAADGEAERYRHCALGAVQSIRLWLGDGSAPVDGLPIGVGAGLGGVAYALMRVGHFLNEAALVEESTQMVRRLTPEIIQADRQLDIVSGAAGAILCLLAVHAARPDDGVLELAVACGRQLLARRTADGQGRRAWISGIGPDAMLSGFAHGAAGIAYSLLRLHRVCGIEEFRHAAAGAIEYEDSLFAPEVGNWLDLRKDLSKPSDDGAPPPRFGNSWCTGAAGIGLARLGGLDGLDTPAIRADIDHALAAAQAKVATSQDNPDCICCGNFGLIELLLTAGQQLGRPELGELAHRRAAEIVAQAGPDGGYWYANYLPRGLFSPGLFQGAAGVGYQLLRLACPERVPAVLLWS
jgi:type 2 lantibiotic biosynthesis protein LanM